MKKEKANKDYFYEYQVVPDTYLGTALFITNRLNELKNNEFLSNQDNFFNELGFKSCHSEYLLIYPIIYNIKHGVELYIKGLGNIDNEEYFEIHDLDLF